MKNHVSTVIICFLTMILQSILPVMAYPFENTQSIVMLIFGIAGICCGLTAYVLSVRNDFDCKKILSEYVISLVISVLAVVLTFELLLPTSFGSVLFLFAALFITNAHLKKNTYSKTEYLIAILINPMNHLALVFIGLFICIAFFPLNIPIG